MNDFFLANKPCRYIQFCGEAGIEYRAAAGNFTDISLKVLLEPTLVINKIYPFVRAVNRITTLASFLSTSLEAAATTDPATNAGIGSNESCKIAYMPAILAVKGRGFAYLRFREARKKHSKMMVEVNERVIDVKAIDIELKK